MAKVINVNSNTFESRDIGNVIKFLSKRAGVKKPEFVVGERTMIFETKTPFESVFFRIKKSVDVFTFNNGKYTFVEKVFIKSNIHNDFPILYFLKRKFNMLLVVDYGLKTQNYISVAGEFSKIDTLKELNSLPRGVRIWETKEAKEMGCLFQL